MTTRRMINSRGDMLRRAIGLPLVYEKSYEGLYQLQIKKGRGVSNIGPVITGTRNFFDMLYTAYKVIRAVEGVKR